MVRAAAARSLGMMDVDTGTIVPHLIEALNDKNPRVWAGAAEALAFTLTDTKAAIDRLREIARLDDTVDLNVEEYYKPGNLKILSNDYTDEEAAEYAAAFALTILSPDDYETAVKKLMSGVYHKCQFIRGEAVKYLSSIGPEPEIISVMINALCDVKLKNRHITALILGVWGDAAKAALP